MAQNIKSFIYLDDYKLYSLSSQLFQGFTEYIISENAASLTEEESQKGMFASGKIMSDLLKIEKASAEKKYLHDYAFNLLETELTNRGILYAITPEDTTDTIQTKGIVKIIGRAVFNDYRTLQSTMSHFNSLGESFGYFQHKEEITTLNDIASNALKSINDRNQRAKIKNIKQQANEALTSYLQKNGLHIAENDIKHMLNIMEYGFHGELEFRVSPNELPFQFSAILNREYLRDTETQFVSKYSRQTEYDFTMIGIVTQSGKTMEPLAEHIPNSLKNACLNLSDKLTNVEKFFLGRLDNECIIDPIAIYREL